VKSCQNKRHHHAVTTVTQSRSAIFAPTLRPTAKSTAVVVVQTPWATATVSRVQLTQTHRDILDVLFTFFTPHYRPDGSLVFCFSPHSVMRRLGHRGGVNLQWLRGKFDDLEGASLEVKTSQYTVRTSIIRKHGWRHDGSQYAAVLESDYVAFFAKDVRVHSEALTNAIMELEHAPAKALVRFVLTHQNWNQPLRQTLDYLGYIGGDRSRRRAMAEIRSESAALQRDFGIRLDGKNVVYRQHDLVWFELGASSQVQLPAAVLPSGNTPLANAAVSQKRTSCDRGALGARTSCDRGADVL
jgi:hypothetical protein